MDIYQLNQTNRPLGVIKYWDADNMLIMDQHYQRGDVWGITRRRNLIRSIVQGVPIPSIIVNYRQSDIDVLYSVIDGKQRITTILGFLNNQFYVPSEWFGEKPKRFIEFKDLPLPKQRRFKNRPIQFTEGSIPEEQEVELFELVNFGGVPQGKTDNDIEMFEKIEK